MARFFREPALGFAARVRNFLPVGRCVDGLGSRFRVRCVRGFDAADRCSVFAGFRCGDELSPAGFAGDFARPFANRAFSF